MSSLIYCRFSLRQRLLSLAKASRAEPFANLTLYALPLLNLHKLYASFIAAC